MTQLTDNTEILDMMAEEINRLAEEFAEDRSDAIVRRLGTQIWLSTGCSSVDGAKDFLSNLRESSRKTIAITMREAMVSNLVNLAFNMTKRQFDRKFSPGT